jgi:hypothetical protein
MLLTYSTKRVLFTDGFDPYHKIKNMPVRTPWCTSFLRRGSESCDITVSGVNDSFLAITHMVVDVHFTFGDAQWSPVWLSTIFEMIIFLCFRFSQSEMPTLSKWKTNSAFTPSTHSRKKHIILSRKAHGISSLGSSSGVLLVFVTLSRWCKMKDSTHPRLTKWGYFVSQ